MPIMSLIVPIGDAAEKETGNIRSSHFIIVHKRENYPNQGDCLLVYGSESAIKALLPAPQAKPKKKDGQQG